MWEPDADTKHWSSMERLLKYASKFLETGNEIDGGRS